MMTLGRPSRTRPQPAPDAPAPAGLGWDDATIGRLTWAFVGLGVFLRLARYLQRFPLWHDEAFLAVSFLNRGFGQLLEPLDYLQVSPILFVAAEWGVVRLFGFNEWTLRLVPALCGIAGLVLFRHLARRLLPPWPALVAVGILAVSYSPLRHGNEVKPYATDLLVSVAFLTLAIHAWKADPTRRARWIWGLAAFTPVALSASLPAPFLAGGVALALAGPVLESRRWPELLALAVYGLSILLSFGLVLKYSAGTAATEILREHYLLDYWSRSFPPTGQGPLAVAGWLARIHVGNLLAYPAGGEGGASALTVVCLAVGIAAMVRKRLAVPLILLLAPFALNLVAAFLSRYPYGGEARIAQHLAPPVCLLAGLGAARIVESARSPGRRVRLSRGLLGGLVLCGVVLFFWGVVAPYHIATSSRSREFARWFWPTMESGTAVVCVKSDLRRDFEPWQWMTGISAEYLCNQRIYSTRSLPLPPLDGAPPPPVPNRPLRCVIYGVNAYDLPWHKPAFRDWVDPLRSSYLLTRIQTFEINTGLGLESWKEERYHVLEFVSRTGSPAKRGPDALDRLLAGEDASAITPAGPMAWRSGAGLWR